MWGMIIGFVLRYLPALFGFVGDIFKGKQEDAREEKMIARQIEMEKVRAQLANEGKKLDAETQAMLANVQADIEGMRAAMEDRKSARAYGVQALNLIAKTLSLGKDLGIPGWVLSIGWFLGLSVEVLAASVQPGIAVVVMTMWAVWKFSSPSLAWGPDDWWLMEAVIGFFLAGRLQKWQEQKRCSPPAP